MLIGRQLLGAALAAALVSPAYATSVALVADGQWNGFAVDDQVGPSFGLAWVDTETLSPGYGTPLSFDFIIASGQVSTLTVVDGAFAGDRFRVSSNGAAIGDTSVVPAQSFDTAPNVGSNFDGALADSNFSRGVFTFAAGSYHVSGSLIQSLTLDGAPLNATAGALKLTTAAVPLPGSAAMLLSSLAALGAASRRRRA